MASCAGIKFQIVIARRAACSIGFVAFFASYFKVRTSKRITRLRVIKLLYRFPAFYVVALAAFAAKLPLVRIGVARRAVGRLPKERFRCICVFDEHLARREHVGGGVALFARNGDMCAVEGVTG